MKAFTLAEILITLGLLGTVSAMTIPTLAYSYRGKILEEQYKTAYSDLKEISSRINENNGDIGEFANKYLATSTDANDWADKFVTYLHSASKIESTSTPIETIKGMYKSAGKPQGPFEFNSSSSADICSDSNVWIDSKGRMFTFNQANRLICIDINGTNAPNKLNIDIFAFKIITAQENATISEDTDNINDYSGTIIPCDISKVSLDSSNNDGCPYYFPMQNSIPTNDSGELEKSSRGKTLKKTNTYWREYIDFR